MAALAEKKKGSSLVYAGAALLIVVGAYAYHMYPSSSTALTDKTAKSYTSAQFGISFLYPHGYTIKEDNVGPSAPLHHVITFVPEGLSAVPQNSEAPAGIAFEIRENEPVEMSAETFIRTDPASNWNIATSGIVPKTYGSVSGMEYSWSGLYEGRSFVVARRGFIYVFSVTRFEPTDAALSDFDRILSTLELAE
ncbi:MAG TPA: hypothetical protein VHE10_03045 [Candidatus Paceibacterota bacterium]|nr:hypothetical protein [Candidatus Paceibacterota bacterium]